VIPRDFIVEWREQAPWADDAMVEQDLILCRALVDIFQVPEVGRTLAFRGGTALHKLHLRPSARYSEDIDLVQTTPGPVGPILDGIRSKLDPWLGSPKRKFKNRQASLVYRMSSEPPNAVPMRLKIEINTSESFSVIELIEHTFAVRSRWYTGDARITTYEIDELLSTKLRALYQRKKGRDLFDIWYAFNHARVEPARIVECFAAYMKHEGRQVSRAEFEANLSAKEKDRAFADDTAPLLAPGTSWKPDEAFELVFRELVRCLPGEPWKGKKDRP
jgi:predicted nucleotidyltransferase component of viral defense system